MMIYKIQETLHGETFIRINDDGSVTSIPNNPDNTDWQQYQAWLAEGNQPLPPEGAK